MGYYRNKTETDEIKNLIKNGKKKFVRLDEGAVLYSIGVHSFRKIAIDAGATYHVGKTVLVNTEIVDDYLEHFRDDF